MDILNFISWIKSGKYSPTIPSNAVTVVGVPNPTRGDAYLPVTVPVSAFGGSTGSNIGKLLGGGIVVAEWNESGIQKGLIASLTDISAIIEWTTPAFVSGPAIGATAQSLSNGSTNTDAIIAQAGVLNSTYAAGAARSHTGGGFADWYLPALWELTMCYNVATIINRVLGTNGFANNTYWSSTEDFTSSAWGKAFFGAANNLNFSKNSNILVRAVRIHTL